MKFLALIIISSLTLSLSAKEVTLTEQNFKSVTSVRPVVAFTSLDCDLGKYASDGFRNAFQDMEGVDIAIVDVNNAYKIFDGFYNFGLGSMVLIKNGVVLESSHKEVKDDFYEPYVIGYNQKRVWLKKNLEKHKIPVKLDTASSDRVPPVATVGNVDLNLDALVYFNFATGNKDLISNTNLFKYQGPIFALKDKAIYGNGNYDSRISAEFYQNKSGKPNGIADGVSIFFDINLSKIGKNACSEGLFASLNGGNIDFGTFKGKLFIKLESIVGKKDWLEVLYLEDTNIPLHKWTSVGLSLDPNQKRAYVMINGKRIKDVILTDQYVTMLRAEKPKIRSFSLHQFRCGAVLHGFIDRIAIYERTLNGNEMLAFYNEKSRKGVGGVSEEAKPNVEILNKQLIAGVQKNDLAQVKASLEGGAEVNFLWQGWSSLMIASYNGNTQIVDFLISKGANPLLEVSGFNAQKLAEAQGHESVVVSLENYSNTERFYFERKISPIQVKSKSIVKLPKEL